MKKIVRNMSTPESQRFWEKTEEIAKEVEKRPPWKRAGINVSQLRPTPREVKDD